METFSEDRKNLADLYRYGNEWLNKIYDSLKEQDAELEKLRQRDVTFSQAQKQIESLAQLVRSTGNE